MATAKNTTPAAKSAPATKAPASKPAATATAAKAAPAKAVAPKAAAKGSAAKGTAAAAAKTTKAATTPKSAPATATAAVKAPPAKPAPVKAAAKSAPSKASVPAKAAPAKPAPAPVKTAPAKTAPAKPAPAPAAKKAQVKKAPGTVQASKDFDAKFLDGQLAALLAERVQLTGQARRLEDEANSLIEDVEMGDVQFDDESGEGDTMVVERERDLALSAQARQIVTEIDLAIERIAEGTYGYSVQSGLPIPKERLKAIPWATLRVDEKAGGIGRR